jgi:bleomycin hydrolase
MLGTIETEHLMQGDSVVLSSDYLARMLLTEKVRERYLTKGRKLISMRGMMPMAIHLLEQYGVEPLASYHAKSKINYHVVGRKLEQITDVALARRQGLEYLEERVNDLLDSTIDFMPKFVFMLGAEYTPLEFAHSVCRENEYDNYTSFAHHPFGSRFILETPDNLMNDSFLNLPIDGLMNLIVNRLKNGRAVCWEGDISEPGFDAENGVGEVPEKKVTQEMRQQQFESLKTTDDHCMSIVGMAHDKQGNRYFIMKNSWGTSNRFHGFIYLSYNYVKLKTIAIFA